MKAENLCATILGIAAMIFVASPASAQDCASGNCGGGNYAGSYGGYGGGYSDRSLPGTDYATNVHNWNMNKASQYPWHGCYYHRQWGVPLAMVVPPTASYETEYNWGVARTRSVPIYHQYGYGNPGPGSGGQFAPTPYWPSSTSQFGIYPVRGPW